MGFGLLLFWRTNWLTTKGVALLRYGAFKRKIKGRIACQKALAGL